jgi:hypothetical protein
MKPLRVLAAVCLAAAFVVLEVPVAAHAQVNASTEFEKHPTADPALPGSVKIDTTWAYTGAVITGPGLAKPRRLNAYQAATFVQSWLAPAIFGKPVISDPPKSVPVFLVSVTGVWGSPTKTTLPVYYARQGDSLWISFPVTIGDGATSTTVPKPTKWFMPPDAAQVQHAFEGTAKLVSTAGTAPVQVTPSTTVPATTTTGKKSSSSATGWIIVLAIVGVVLVGLVVMRIMGRGSKPKPDTPKPDVKVGAPS